MMIYIGDIMVYKFGVEVFIGSFISLATNRYDYAARLGGYAPLTFGRIGLMQGLNQACQCFGAILVAPLVKRWETRIVLSVAILVFAVFTTVILIADAATGGTFKPPGASLDDFTYYGKFNTDGMIPVYCVTGFVYGMVELTRRVIVRDIVHSDGQSAPSPPLRPPPRSPTDTPQSKNSAASTPPYTSSTKSPAPLAPSSARSSSSPPSATTWPSSSPHSASPPPP
jgi:hypothetical protein